MGGGVDCRCHCLRHRDVFGHGAAGTEVARSVVVVGVGSDDSKNDNDDNDRGVVGSARTSKEAS